MYNLGCREQTQLATPAMTTVRDMWTDVTRRTTQGSEENAPLCFPPDSCHTITEHISLNAGRSIWIIVGFPGGHWREHKRKAHPSPVRQRQPCQRRGVVGRQPVLYHPPLVGVSVRSDDGLRHDLLRSGRPKGLLFDDIYAVSLDATLPHPVRHVISWQQTERV